MFRTVLKYGLSRKLHISSLYCIHHVKQAPFYTQGVSHLHRDATSSIKPLSVSKQHQQHDLGTKLTKHQDGWRPVKVHSLKERLFLYSKLSKAKLSGLVVLTAAAGYAIAPGTLVPLTLACTVAGTTLCSASANSLNQMLEVPYDCQMSRTKDRVLVQGKLRPFEATCFGIGSGIAGVVLLLSTVNPTTAILGALNIGLYAGVYTPFKRMHIANTWIGAVVGAIPPLMGWAACMGGFDARALTLATILYSWQFPHFNALSWNYRADYSRAGYKMMSVTHPALCRRVTLRHAVGQIPLAAVVSLLGVTNWSFFFFSLPFNVYLSMLSWRFYKQPNSNTARSLFRFTLLHLPLVMFLLLLCKKRADLITTSKTGTIEDIVNFVRPM